MGACACTNVQSHKKVEVQNKITFDGEVNQYQQQVAQENINSNNDNAPNNNYNFSNNINVNANNNTQIIHQPQPISKEALVIKKTVTEKESSGFKKVMTNQNIVNKTKGNIDSKPF